MAGMALHMITGQVVWEASASLAIGLLLGYVAYRLGREARDQLIGEAADPRTGDRIRELLRAQPEIDSVEALFTMKTGLDTALVAARVDLVPGLDSERVEEVAVRIKRSIVRVVPEASQVFLDVTERGAVEAWEGPAATGNAAGLTLVCPAAGASCATGPGNLPGPPHGPGSRRLRPGRRAPARRPGSPGWSSSGTPRTAGTPPPRASTTRPSRHR